MWLQEAATDDSRIILNYAVSCAMLYIIYTFIHRVQILKKVKKIISENQLSRMACYICIKSRFILLSVASMTGEQEFSGGRLNYQISGYTHAKKTSHI